MFKLTSIANKVARQKREEVVKKHAQVTPNFNRDKGTAFLTMNDLSPKTQKPGPKTRGPIQCECPDSADRHRPGQCTGMAVHHIERDGKEMNVCWDCILTEDKTLGRVDQP